MVDGTTVIGCERQPLFQGSTDCWIFLALGEHTLTAVYSGDSNYGPGNSAPLTQTVLATAPAAPGAVSAVAGDRSATVSWAAPGSDGGDPITSYTVTSTPDSLTCTTASELSCEVTGLTNGTDYTFAVTAANGVGPSSPSAASAPVTPKGPQTISFPDPGPQDFGSQPTLVASSSSGLAVSFSSATPAVCAIDAEGSLTTVGVGTCTVLADQAGDAAYEPAPQVAHSFAILATAPAAPGAVSAVAGDRSAIVSWAAPGSDGGDPITSYTVTSTPDSLTCTTASELSCEVTGLTNGTDYTFAVTAANGVGPSSPSAASAPVTPKGPQTISFDPPADRALGSPAFDLDATASSGLPVLFSGDSDAVCAVAGATVELLGAGECRLTAAQPGDNSHLAAPDVPVSFLVERAASRTELGAAPATTTEGESVTFTAEVSGYRPGGRVVFRSDADVLGSSTLDAAGRASLSTAALGLGSHPIVAAYAGDADNEPSTAAPLVVRVDPRPAPVRVTQPQPTPQPSCRPATVTTSNFMPGRGFRGRQVSGVRARLKVDAPSRLRIAAKLRFKLRGHVRTAKLPTRRLVNPGIRNLRLPLPAGLRRALPPGTSATLTLRIRAVGPCGKPRTSRTTLQTRVVRVLAAPQRR